MQQIFMTNEILNVELKIKILVFLFCKTSRIQKLYYFCFAFEIREYQ